MLVNYCSAAICRRKKNKDYNQESAVNLASILQTRWKPLHKKIALCDLKFSRFGLLIKHAITNSYSDVLFLVLKSEKNAWS